MKVSAVITTLNEEHFIASCIESLLSQTVKPEEIILIDAQSTDRTLEIARQYPIDRFYQVTFHDIYRSKRLGILLSKNDYVLCIDGDTTIAPDFVEKALKLLDKGYDVATGYTYPHNPNPLTNLIAWIQNHSPLYLSGPAYLIRKQAYLSTCKIRQVDGIVDACEMSKEVPLQKFEGTIKCPELIIHTDLPSTMQKKIIATAAMLAVSIPVAIFLWSKRK